MQVTGQKHGKGKYIDYSKCDVFGCGMVAHNMLSGLTSEPFSVGSSKDYDVRTCMVCGD